MTFDDFLLSWARARLAAKTDADAGAHRTAYELLKLKRRRIQSGIAKPRPVDKPKIRRGYWPEIHGEGIARHRVGRTNAATGKLKRFINGVKIKWEAT